MAKCSSSSTMPSNLPHYLQIECNPCHKNEGDVAILPVVNLVESKIAMLISQIYLTSIWLRLRTHVCLTCINPHCISEIIQTELYKSILIRVASDSCQFVGWHGNKWWVWLFSSDALYICSERLAANPHQIYLLAHSAYINKGCLLYALLLLPCGSHAVRQEDDDNKRWNQAGGTVSRQRCARARSTQTLPLSCQFRGG